MLSLSYYIKNPRIFLLGLLKKCNYFFPDKFYVRLNYYLEMGKWPNLSNPQTYNEKLQWLKLYDRRPEYTMMVDKYAVKKYVAKLVGEQYVIPTIGVWNSPEEIDWDNLPCQFVLKTTHGGGNEGVVVCKDKSTFDRSAACEKLRKSLKQDLYKIHREWQYKGVRKRIIAEEYKEDSKTHSLDDYKFFCFNGEVKALFVATGRQEYDEPRFDYFDADFNHLDLIQHHPMSGKIITKPISFGEMKKVAQVLSKGLPSVRIDLYEVDGKVYFGEYTFTHHGGLVPFHPEKWDYTFGSWITLPSKNNEHIDINRRLS